MRVVVVPYDPRWPERFREVRDELLRALEEIPVRAIEHVGSTAVPGLVAKPRLDIDVVVARADVDAARRALEADGYVWLGERGITDRHAFRPPDRGPARNVYLVVEGCLALRNHLAVRDLLRRDDELREAYGRSKLELAERDYSDSNDYASDKTAVLQRILEAAGMGREELAAIEAMNRPSSESGGPFRPRRDH